ncbi:MAG: DUF523 domain-containing protein [Vicinamibacterales bacterium]
MTLPVRVGISACLLGEEVRYDGGHKRAQFLIDAFGPSIEWVSICPEVEAGFGTPREPMRLSRVDGVVRLLTVTTAHDVTPPMEDFVRRRVAELRRDHLSGYILKSNSPSCGLEGVAVFDRQGNATEPGRGLFAEALVREFPELPVEDEGRLSDPHLLNAFVERVFAYHRATKT